MTFCNEETLEKIKRDYPKGTKVVLEYMDDPQSPPDGTNGIVDHVDDTGTIHIHWSNGSSLGAIYGVDRIRKE